MESNEELLSKILRSEKAAYEVAKHRIDDLVHATRTELGLTRNQFAQLQAAIELGRRVSEARLYQSIDRIENTQTAIAFCQQRFRRLIQDALQEEFHIVTLNTKHNIINTHQITVGTLDASLVHPREVFRPAIRDASSAILLAHNHPSGCPEPSRQDFEVTRRLTEVGNTIGIQVLDHIVMGTKGCVSIRELQ